VSNSVERQAAEARRRKELDNAYRAVGLYFVRFSEMVWVMRRAIGRSFETNAQPVLVDAVISEMMAYNMARAFFATCAMNTALDEKAEQPIASRLRNVVIAAIEDRNQLAHGDWLLLQGFGPGAGLEPKLARFDLTSSEPGPILRDVPVATIDQRSGALSRLSRLLYAFGEICLPSPNQPARFTVAERFELGQERISLRPDSDVYASKSEFKI
jgi:hypothetical protein